MQPVQSREGQKIHTDRGERNAQVSACSLENIAPAFAGLITPEDALPLTTPRISRILIALTADILKVYHSGR